MKKYIQYLMLIIVTGVSAFYFYTHKEDLRILAEIQFLDVLLVAFVLLLFFSLTGYTFKLLVKLLGIELTFKETFGLSILTNFGNYLGPTRPGAALKALYLKSVKGLSYSHFAAVLAANTFIVFFMTGLVGAILLCWLYFCGKSVPALLVGVCAGLIFLSFIPYWLKELSLFSRWEKLDLVSKALEGFAIIRDQKSKLLLICLTFLGQFGLSAILYMLVFKGLGIPVDFISAMVVGVFTSVANFFTITPNNLGIQEAVSAYLLAITGCDFNAGVIGSTLVRVVHIAITFSLAPWFSYSLMQNIDPGARKPR